MIKYQVYQTKEINIDCGEYTSYGLSANKIYDGQDIPIDRLDDISTDEALVREICNYCNLNKVSPFFVSEVVSDFLM